MHVIGEISVTRFSTFVDILFLGYCTKCFFNSFMLLLLIFPGTIRIIGNNEGTYQASMGNAITNHYRKFSNIGCNNKI